MIEPKVSRADLRYQPQVKELKDVVCFPIDKPEDRIAAIKVLNNYINEETDTRGGEGSAD